MRFFILFQLAEKQKNITPNTSLFCRNRQKFQKSGECNFCKTKMEFLKETITLAIGSHCKAYFLLNKSKVFFSLKEKDSNTLK
jgi:hypothetical protein